MWIAQIGVLLAIGLLIGFFGTMLIVAVVDWHQARKTRVWVELQKTNYERRRPAAK